MDFSSNFLAVAAISLIAAVSPGPDFFIVFRNSLVYSRKAGIFTAIGVSMAIFIHLTYTLIGIGVLIAKTPMMYDLLKYIGAIYLLYLGFKGIISSFKQSDSITNEYNKEVVQISDSSAFMQGFWTNLLNPKCAIFFVSLFSQFIDNFTPFAIGLEYGLITWSIILGWFCFLAYMLTQEFLLKRINQFRIYIDRVMGGALMMLGFKILYV